MPLAEAQNADADSTWTIQDENASITTAKLPDRNYVNGLRIGWTSPTDTLVPSALADVGHTLWGDGRERIAFDLSQSIFTPSDTQTTRPSPYDRPYAGVLTGNFYLTEEAPGWRSTLGLQLGVVGPAALGEEVQNGFHDIIGQGHNRGWGSQIRNEPVLALLSQRVWRLPISQFGALETDALPDLEIGAGNLRVYALTGAAIRLGQGLTSDYGVARVRPGMTGGDAFTPTRPFAWYVFAGLDGQAVAHDLTLDGNTFENSAHVSRQPWLGEAELGLAVIYAGVRLSYTQVVQTQAFHGQHGGLHQVGSLALSAKF
jgi:hypothetical protein